jgi:urease accessory protein
MKLKSALRSVPLLLISAPLAEAHPGHGPASLAAGFAHPFTGWDHLLAMVAVGLWAAQLGGRFRWALPAAFVSAMIVGAAVGIAGGVPPGVEWGILASVLVLGLALAGAIRVPLGAGLAIVAAAGLMHGIAHGAERPLRADSLRFLTGMVAATALLHAAGLAAGWATAQKRPALARMAGAAIAAGAVGLIFA